MYFLQHHHGWRCHLSVADGHLCSKVAFLSPVFFKIFSVVSGFSKLLGVHHPTSLQRPCLTPRIRCARPCHIQLSCCLFCTPQAHFRPGPLHQLGHQMAALRWVWKAVGMPVKRASTAHNPLLHCGSRATAQCRIDGRWHLPLSAHTACLALDALAGTRLCSLLVLHRARLSSVIATSKCMSQFRLDWTLWVWWSLVVAFTACADSSCTNPVEPLCAGKFVPGCYALVVNDDMPEQLRVSSVGLESGLRQGRAHASWSEP